MSGKPLFWLVFDKAEEIVAPRLEDTVRSDAFLTALGLVARGRARARREVERRTRRLWHLVNLPAGSDVTRLRRELAELDREVRQMRTAFEHAVTGRRPEEVREDDGERPA